MVWPFFMSVFVRVYVICSFNKESRIFRGFVYCLFHIFLWFLQTEYTSYTSGTSLFCLPFGSLALLASGTL